MSKCFCNESDDSSEKSICKRARFLWLFAGRTSSCSIDDELKRVEALYRTVLENQADEKCCKACLENASEKLALLLLQSGRTKEADSLLVELGYTCRLSESIFNHDSSIETLPLNYDDSLGTKVTGISVPSNTDVGVAVFDNFLTQEELHMLHTVFLDPKANYWRSISYSVEPPSPYASHVVEISNGTALGRLALRLRDVIDIPTIAQARHVELWAHHRPIPTGHQLHFDSDNEGCTSVLRNPIASCVLYLTEGAPVVVTNQRLQSRTLASSGFVCHAKPNRLVWLDGKLLHGVIPGKYKTSPTEMTKKNADNMANKEPVLQQRRVSVMLAFWKRIRVRDNIGAAMPLSPRESWATPLLVPETTQPVQLNERPPKRVKPIRLSHVYESLETGNPWTRQMGLPPYEEIFQG